MGPTAVDGAAVGDVEERDFAGWGQLTPAPRFDF